MELLKQCPICNKTYSENMEYCLNDGSNLTILQNSDETLVIIKNKTIKNNEPQMNFSLELFRVYCLFGYETDGMKQSHLWDNPMNFHRLKIERGIDFITSFNSWKLTKRKFTEDEIIDGFWVKISDAGYQFRVNFHDDGTLTECALFSFDDKDNWAGEWKLIDGVLRMNVQDYELDIVANKSGLHSGVEDKGENRGNYFKVVHIKI